MATEKERPPEKGSPMAAADQSVSSRLRPSAASRNDEHTVTSPTVIVLNMSAAQLSAIVRDGIETATPKQVALPRRYTQSELAEIYGVSRAVVNGWAKAGLPRIPCGAQSPRYDLTEVDAWLRTQERGQ
jgi:hypothetical protein